MSRLRDSVRFQLPAFLVVVGIVVYSATLWVALGRTTRTALASREQAARTSLNAVARVAADLLYRDQRDSMHEMIAQLGAVSDLDVAAYVDPLGRMEASTHRDWVGQPVDSFPVLGAASLVREAVQLDRSVTRHDADGRTVLAIPVRAGSIDPQGEVTGEGVLLATLDFRPLVADVRRQTFEFYLLIGVVSLAAIVAVTLFLHFRVARPALQIAGAAERGAAGDLRVRAGVWGDDELGRAGRAFDDMVRHVDETEQALRRQQALLDGLMRTVPVGVLVVDRRTLEVLYANQPLRQLGGYPVPIGRPLREVATHIETDAGRPYPIERLPIERALTEGRSVEADDVVYVQPDGTRVPVVTTAHPMNISGGPEFDAVVAVVQDRRTLERAFRQLRESEERFQKASLATGQAVYAWDMTTDACRFSDSVTSVFGYAPEEIDSNEKWDAITHPDDVAASKAEMTAARREHRVFDHVSRIRHKDGRWRWVRDRGVLRYDDAGQPVSMVGAVADVTEQHELEARLRQAQKMETVGTLAGGIAHDFNNQLTGVLGHLDLLREDMPGDDPRLEHVRVARLAAARCAELTRGLLAFSRMLRGDPRAVDVNESVREAAALLRRALPATIELVLETADDLPRAQVDPTQLQQVLLNLCVNARDAMPEGGTLRITTRRTTLDAPRGTDVGAVPGEYVRIEVSDEGVGIPADVLPRIFEPFFTTKPVGAGTGLGLAMVYGIVSQHRGWVDVESTPGAGTTFRVHLPASSGQAVAREGDAEAMPRAGEAPPRTVLVVDDEAVVRDFAARILERVGWNVLRASDGREAMQAVAAHTGAIDAVLLDMTMPGPPLREVVEALRRALPGARLVLTSGYSLDLSGQHELAALPFLTKPYSPQQLLEAMRAIAPAAPA